MVRPIGPPSPGPAPRILSVAPNNIFFGGVANGASSLISVTITATGGAITVSGVSVTGAPFSLGSFSVPVIIAVNQSVQLQVKFAPTALGNFSDTLVIANNGDAGTVNVPITGTGLAPSGSICLVTPSPMYFPPLGPDSPTPGVTPFQVTNGGSTTFNVTGAGISSPDTPNPFSLFVPSLPQTLTPGQSLSGTSILGEPLVFTPGLYTGTLQIATDIAGSTTIDVSLFLIVYPINPVSVLTGTVRNILLSITNGGATPLVVLAQNSYLNQNDALIVFNGCLWNKIGQEKTLMRLEVLFEDIGQFWLELAVTSQRPSLGADSYDTKTVLKQFVGGTAVDDSSIRTDYFDIEASGEILEMSITKPAKVGSPATQPGGQCKIIGFIAWLVDKGEKVEGV